MHIADFHDDVREDRVRFEGLAQVEIFFDTTVLVAASEPSALRASEDCAAARRLGAGERIYGPALNRGCSISASTLLKRRALSPRTSWRILRSYPSARRTIWSRSTRWQAVDGAARKLTTFCCSAARQVVRWSVFTASISTFFVGFPHLRLTLRIAPRNLNYLRRTSNKTWHSCP